MRTTKAQHQSFETTELMNALAAACEQSKKLRAAVQRAATRRAAIAKRSQEEKELLG